MTLTSLPGPAHSTARKTREGDRLTPALDDLIELLWTASGTDLHLTLGSPPLLRIDGALVPAADMAPLSADDVVALVLPLLTDEQAAALDLRREIDFSFSWRELARMRGNAYSQRGMPALALRLIPHEIPSMAELGLPAAVTRFADLKQGLVLVTGPTGSGKSTTLASLIDAINISRPCHILTIEDPIEYVHRHKQGMVTQREVGLDSVSFPDALRSALREDPDVILVGEMRDLESIQFALTLAETGHLVFATLHTNDTSQAIDRLIDVFAADRQAQIRVQLANSLTGVVYQRLLPRMSGGMVAAYEVLVATAPVRNLIKEGKTNQLRNCLVTGGREGMLTFEQSLSHLVRCGLIRHADAVGVSLHPGELEVPLSPAQANG